MPETFPGRILALIPAYNEADHIRSVIEDASRYLPVLVVDDGSTDHTALIAEEYGAKVLRQIRNQGKGEALKAGFRIAISEEYQAVVTMDADGQHDPIEIPKFLDSFSNSHADLIIGERDFRLIPYIRRVSNTLGRWMFSWAAGGPVPDNQSGYRLISKRLMETMLQSPERGFEFEVDMIVVCLEKDFPIQWVPIRTIYAGERSHIQPLRHVVLYFRIVWQTRQRMRQIARDRSKRN